MDEIEKILEIQTYKKGENILMHVVDIKDMTCELSKLIDQYLVSICEGCGSESEIDIVKERINSFLNSKSEKTRMGAIAEFFIHLYLNCKKYKQECMFFNLEENSIKKGFDGYYSTSNDEWIMESKSGKISTENISHAKKVLEAYNDLKSKIEGNTTNNPWHNAYNHSSHIDVKSGSDIRKHLRELAKEFSRKKYSNIAYYNIIPASTIFLENEWGLIKTEEIVKSIEEITDKLEFKQMTVVCITKKSIQLFYTYLRQRSA